MSTQPTADIAIIGGGIIGLSCAYELARQSDRRIVVFDKQLPASGTTGGSAGVICLHDMGALYASLTLLGFARVTELSRDHEFGFRPWGTLFVVYGEGKFPPEPDAYEQRFGGQPHSIYQREFLSPVEMRERFPWIRASVEAVVRRYWHLPKSVFLNGWCCVYGTTEDGFPIVSRDERLTNFYHALGMNGHGMTCHAGIAQIVTELMLRNGTSIDLSAVLGRPGRLDFTGLNAARFRRRELLDFQLR